MRSKLQKELKAALKEVIARIPVIAPGCEIRPTDPRSFYQVRNDREGLTFDFPVTGLRLRRVAGDDKASLYVALSGTIVFDTEQKTGKPLVHWFSTRISYFHASKAGMVNHLLALHYDCDPARPGHPLYHAQLSSNPTEVAANLQELNRLFGTNLALDKDAMCATGAANKVRIPSAHMDMMSVIAQLVADHLIDSNSNEEQKDGFERMRDRLLFFKSHPERDGRMKSVVTNNCFRGLRWYPLP